MFCKNSFWLQSGDRRLGRTEGKREEMVAGTRVREKGCPLKGRWQDEVDEREKHLSLLEYKLPELVPS